MQMRMRDFDSGDEVVERAKHDEEGDTEKIVPLKASRQHNYSLLQQRDDFDDTVEHASHSEEDDTE